MWEDTYNFQYMRYYTLWRDAAIILKQLPRSLIDVWGFGRIPGNSC